MRLLEMIPGEGHDTPPAGGTAAGAARAVRSALRRGYRVGRRVRIGRIEGCVIGYNIAAYGRYVGADYPLLVATDLGVAKCRLEELRLE
jgi:hypothetical protein